MTQTQKMIFMETNYLPKICRRSQCIRDVIKGTDFCSAHQPKPKPVPPGWEGKDVVYMIGMRNSNAMKVGYASNLGKRITGMQVGSPEELFIYAVFAGSRISEQHVHRELQEHHVRGEWFEAEAVMKLAENLARHGYARMRLKLGDVLALPNKNGYSLPNYGEVRKKLP